MAVRGAVAIGVRVGHAAAALSGRDLVGIVRAAIDAVGRAVAVGVDVDQPATALSGRDLERIVRAAVDAVGRSIAVGVDIGDAAAADTGRRLVRVVRAAVQRAGVAREARVAGTVAVGVGAAVARVAEGVAVRVGLVRIRNVRAVVDRVRDAVTVAVLAVRAEVEQLDVVDGPAAELQAAVRAQLELELHAGVVVRERAELDLLRRPGVVLHVRAGGIGPDLSRADEHLGLVVDALLDREPALEAQARAPFAGEVDHGRAQVVVHVRAVGAQRTGAADAEVVGPALRAARGRVRIGPGDAQRGARASGGRAALPVVLVAARVEVGRVCPAVRAGGFEVLEERARQHADVEGERGRGRAARKDDRVAAAVRGRDVVVDARSADLAGDRAVEDVAAAVRHVDRAEGGAVAAIAQRDRGERRRQLRHDGGGDVVRAGLVGRVGQVGHVRDRDRRQGEAREALVAEAEVDVVEVRRAVVDVAVVVVEREPLRLDDRVDRGLVVGAHPAQEDVVGDQVAGRVAVGGVQSCADLPGSAHPDFAVGVHLAVAAAVVVAAVLARVEARAHVAARAAEVEPHDRIVEGVHRPDVGVALAHAVVAVARAVQVVEPVAVLVRDDRREGGVRAAAAGRVEVERDAVVVGVAGLRQVDVGRRHEIGRRVARVDRAHPVAQVVDRDEGVRLRRDGVDRGRVERDAVRGIRRNRLDQRILGAGAVEHVVVRADVGEGAGERRVHARVVEEAVRVRVDRAGRALHARVLQRQRRLGVRGRVGREARRRHAADRAVHVELVHAARATQDRAVERVDPVGESDRDAGAVLAAHVDLPGQSALALLARHALVDHELRLGAARRLDGLVLRELQSRELRCRGRGQARSDREAVQTRQRRRLQREQPALRVEEHVDRAVDDGHARDRLVQAHRELVARPDLAERQELHAFGAERRGVQREELIRVPDRAARESREVGVLVRDEGRHGIAAVEQPRETRLRVGDHAPLRALARAPARERFLERHSRRRSAGLRRGL